MSRIKQLWINTRPSLEHLDRLHVVRSVDHPMDEVADGGRAKDELAAELGKLARVADRHFKETISNSMDELGGDGVDIILGSFSLSEGTEVAEE